MNSSFAMKLALVGLSAIIISGCAETRNVMRVQEAAETKIWPTPPETPRYRYVGQLTGEKNFIDPEKGSGTSFVGFLKALVGLGSEGGEERTLHRPGSGIVDSAGRILVTDVGRQAIFVFDEKQGKLDIWNAASEEFNFASPVAIAQARNGDILVTDSKLNRVVRLDSEGNPRGEFGFDQFDRPTGLAVDPQTGHIFVSDTNEHNVKVFDDSGKLVQVIGHGGTAEGEFNAPTHLAFKNDTLLVTDTFNARVQLFDSNGKFIRSIGERGLYVGNLVRPKGVTTDSEGNVYIIESFHDYLLVYDQNARFLLPIGGTGSDVGQFYLPAGIWSDNRDQIYVADMFNGRVAIFQYLGREKTGGQQPVGQQPGSLDVNQPAVNKAPESQ